MALVLKESLKFYKYLIVDLQDYRTRDLPMVRSPVPVIAIITVYLLFVFKWGPEYMKNRKPYSLKITLIIYNALQMIACAGIILYCATLLPRHKWKCTPLQYVTPESLKLLGGGYAYFILKILDLLDTVFFVLRKNDRQITFLHVYHHTLMVLFVWIGLKYIPGGQGVWLPIVNTVVHFIMYGYYLLSVYDDKYKKSIWWKKHITQLQLLQFGILTILYVTPLIYNCGYPKPVSACILLLNFSMIVLFSNFYHQTYIRKNKRT